MARFAFLEIIKVQSDLMARFVGDDGECGLTHLEDTQLKKTADLLHCGLGK